MDIYSGSRVWRDAGRITSYTVDTGADNTLMELELDSGETFTVETEHPIEIRMSSLRNISDLTGLYLKFARLSQNNQRLVIEFRENNDESITDACIIMQDSDRSNKIDVRCEIDCYMC